MYHARQRIDLSQRAIGVSMAALAGVSLVWLAANMTMGGGTTVVPDITLMPQSKVEPKPEEMIEPVIKDTKVTLKNEKIEVEIKDIIIDTGEPEKLETTKDDGVPPVRSDGGGKTGGEPIVAPKTIAPVMRKFELPPYPERSRTLKETGTTTLSYCVSASGRPANVQLAQTSGFHRLDEAAIKWLRDQRFTPGTVDGVASEMCRTYVYEWTLTPR